MPDPTGDKVLATWAEAGALGQAVGARVRPLAAEQQRARRGLPGAGPNTGAPKGGLAVGARGINPRRVPPASRASPTRATCARPAPWLRSMPQLGGGCPRASKPCSRWPSRWAGTGPARPSTWRAVWMLRSIGRALSLPAGCPTSTSLRATASPRSGDATAWATPPSRRCGGAARAPWPGKIPASDSGSAWNVYSSGIMACRGWHTRCSICASSAGPKTRNQLSL